jgi:hypothetical protein
VSLTAVFRETAPRNLARIRSEDQDLFVRTRRAVALLTEQPYPEGAVPWGATVKPCVWARRSPGGRRSG